MKGLPQYEDDKGSDITLRSSRAGARTAFASLTLLLLLVLGSATLSPFFGVILLPITEELCPQHPVLSPPPHAASENYNTVFNSPTFKNASAIRLGGLVQIPSESYDDNGPVGEDPRWDVFEQIPAYLIKTFPLIHSNSAVTLERINTYALLYHLPGSDFTLKPLMLTGHIDVVPVNKATEDQWTHPPYSGYYDGEIVWGRGSVDCKDTVMSILEAVELLLSVGWEPRRGLVIAFGFDEESAGTEGAGKLAVYLDGWLGKNGVALLVDEGGGGVGEMFGTVMALPGTGEKGYLDVKVSLSTPGGHSSVPPPHTSIGLLSQLVVSLEKAPYLPSLSPTSPILSLLRCASTHGNLPEPLPSLVSAASTDKGRRNLAEAYAARGREERYLVSTSQAIDIISGGVKVNALPENAEVTINYRIAIDSSPSIVKNRVTSHLLDLAREHHLSVDAFNYSYLESGKGGHISAIGIGELVAAPIALTTTKQWGLLSGTIGHAFSTKFPQGVIVAPGMDTGNTDTHSYWNLTKEIFRFSPSDPKVNEFIHTVNEHIYISEHLQAIWFFHEFIRNADAANLD